MENKELLNRFQKYVDADNKIKEGEWVREAAMAYAQKQRERLKVKDC